MTRRAAVAHPPDAGSRRRVGAPRLRPRSPHLDEPVAQAEDDGLEPGMHAELGEDARHVVALGAHADVEPAGDLAAAEALGEQLQALALPRGEAVDGPPVL